MFKNSSAQEGELRKYDFFAEIRGQRLEKADDNPHYHRFGGHLEDA